MELNPRKRKEQCQGSNSICPNDPERSRVAKRSGEAETVSSPSSHTLGDQQVDVIDLSSWNDADDKESATRRFYQQYVALRKPCIIDHWVGSSDEKLEREPPVHHDEEARDNVFLHVSASAILKALLQTDLESQELDRASNETMVQVERRPNTADRFGQVRAPQRECWMTIATFLQNICGIRKAGDEGVSSAASKSDDEGVTHEPDDSSLYYLSTQETTNRPVENDDTAPLAPFFGPPCDRLLALHLIPSHIPLAGNLRLSSCNLWMGRCSSTPSHSGLHHDYHDNFYLLLLGQKEFILYPPHDAYHVAMSGDIECIHPNGLISYQNASIQSDGRPSHSEIDCSTKKIAPASASSTPYVAVDEDSSAESNDGFNSKGGDVVIGKGFDYESSDDNDDENGNIWPDDAEEDALDDDDENSEEDGTGEDSEAMLPNNFSWIDPVTMNPDKIVETFPSYSSAKPIRVLLRANQCLYLPASWLHCVISQGNTLMNGKAAEGPTHADGVSIPSSVHMAINYWYHPPNSLENFEHPYKDREYWEKS